VPADTNRPTAGIPWGKACVDPVTGVVSSGTVSVVDTATGKTLKEIVTGLHPNDITASPDGHFLYVANGNEDYVSVISTETDEVTEKIPVGLMEEKNTWLGHAPDALAVTADGDVLFVANGMDNALAVVRLGKKASVKGRDVQSKVEGFIPTGAWPGGIALAEERQKIFVADIEALGARIRFQGMHAAGREPSGRGAYNTHRMMAAVSVIPMPDAVQLATYTNTVRETLHTNRLRLASLLPRDDRKPVPVPERVGEPSVFKHVIYIIKENRTYDQVLGDVSDGDGDPALCAFGGEVTPNMHKLVKSFQLMDHYEASGKCSAEGHLWTDASIVTDYIEKNVRAWFRSYTHVLYDAMAYPKTGFLWDNALDHGRSVMIYGEASVPVGYGQRKWADIYKAYKAGEPVVFRNKTTIDRVRGILSPDYPAYDSHNFPDIMRADVFVRDLHRYEQMEGDQLPALMILALPNDHTAGTSPDHPTPRALVADNDLALGRIIEALTKSRFWKNTVVFVTEDDSQAGWDHVSAYRTVGIVISPYSRLHKTVSTAYNQTSMVRTIEQILGLPPMNMADATATPMFDVFTDTPDTALYLHEENRIPLDEMNPPMTALTGQDLYFARESSRLASLGIDAGEDDLMNRIIWRSFRNDAPYPEHLAGHDDDDD
jgi:YVTN family beta-propeller protein